MQRLKQSDPRAAFRRVYFTCVDANALTTRLQSSDMSLTFVVDIAKNGTRSNIASPSITQVDATNMKGLFYIELSTANLDTPGHAVLKIKNTGGTKTMEEREIVFEVAAALFATAATGTLTTTSMTTDRAEATGAFTTCGLLGLTGANANLFRKVATHTSTGGLFTWTDAVPVAPANGDIFEIINR